MQTGIMAVVAVASVLVGATAHADDAAPNPTPAPTSAPAAAPPAPPSAPAPTPGTAPAAAGAPAGGDAGTPSEKGGPPSGLEVGLRAGYAIPMGNASGAPNDSLSNTFSGAIPIWVDAGYRFASPNLFVGGYFQYDVGLLSTGAGSSNPQCTGSVGCSGGVVMYGLQVHYHFLPEAVFHPWVGLGVGMETMTTTVASGLDPTTSTKSGWDYAIFQVGGDYHAVSSLGGPSSCSASASTATRPPPRRPEATSAGALRRRPCTSG